MTEGLTNQIKLEKDVNVRILHVVLLFWTNVFYFRFEKNKSRFDLEISSPISENRARPKYGIL